MHYTYEEITGLCMPLVTECVQTVRCIEPKPRPRSGPPKIGMLMTKMSPNDSEIDYAANWIGIEHTPLWLLEERYEVYEIDKNERGYTRLIVPDIEDKTGRQIGNDFAPVNYEIVDLPTPEKPYLIEPGYVISMSDDEFFSITGRGDWHVRYGDGDCTDMMDSEKLDERYESFDWEAFIDSCNRDHEKENIELEGKIIDFMENMVLARLYFDRVMRSSEEEGRGEFNGIEINSEDQKKRRKIVYGR